ncbi:phage portal protein [Aliiroseovarius crassostreae]|uniref:phage portal protein n=1 Tax=Aliiroseovarius crassostreae TaxID=154981 RepID=UPI0021B05AC4|nr:phage portal protein [Aliiroseovarius crassostreae]UWQ10238.1 phage portal protein [Aliiroseovarius crassostreae]
MAFPFVSRLFNRPAKPQQTRRFDGAAGGRRGFGMGTFGRVNSEVSASGATLRSRARYLANNNPWLSQAVANWAGALVGSGIVPTPKHPDATTRADVTAAFQGWADDADADGRTDFWGLQADVARGLVIDGEAFLHVLPGEDGPRLRLLPPELVDESLTRELGNGAVIVQGVEFNSEGRRVAYHVLPYRPHDQFANYAPPVRVPADEILHVMKPLAAGQVRGVSWLAPVILSASDFDQLCDALLMGAKVAAMHSAFLIDLNGTGGEPYDGTGEGGILETGLEPGTMKRLPTGYDVKFNTPGQLTEIGAFLRLQLQQLAAGLGLPDHLLSGDLSNANYSSLRAGLLPFRQRVEQIQYGVLVPQFLAPIWRQVVTFAVLSGDLAAPDFETAPRAYAAEWLPPKPMQVDPLKDTQATVAELDAGLTSRRKAVAERGWALEDLDSEIAADPRQNAQKPESSDA